MRRPPRFRKILPITQSLLAAAFTSWGLWERHVILSNAWLGENSTARFHVWPWPLKLAIVLNFPAFLAGSLLALPFEKIRPKYADYVSALLIATLVPMLWYLVGQRLDQHLAFRPERKHWKRSWTTVLLAVLVGLIVIGVFLATISLYTSFVGWGLAIWASTTCGWLALTRRAGRHVS